MKALEILKKDRQFITHVDGISLDEAIAELEALLKPKTCDGCDYEQHKGKSYCEICFNCSRGTPRDRYTPKAQQ